jgi:hypothetical protein
MNKCSMMSHTELYRHWGTQMGGAYDMCVCVHTIFFVNVTSCFICEKKIYVCVCVCECVGRAGKTRGHILENSV